MNIQYLLYLNQESDELYLEDISECKFSGSAETQNMCIYFIIFFILSHVGSSFFYVTSGLHQTYNYLNWLLQNCFSTFMVIISTSLNIQVTDFGKYKVQIL